MKGNHEHGNERLDRSDERKGSAGLQGGDEAGRVAGSVPERGGLSDRHRNRAEGRRQRRLPLGGLYLPDRGFDPAGRGRLHRRTDQGEPRRSDHGRDRGGGLREGRGKGSAVAVLEIPVSVLLPATYHLAAVAGKGRHALDHAREGYSGHPDEGKTGIRSVRGVRGTGSEVHGAEDRAGQRAGSDRHGGLLSRVAGEDAGQRPPRCAG